MPRARDLLDRLRPVGTPGAATPVGVPADRRAEVAAELEPVFALLADVEAECERLRRAADADASRRQTDAAQRAREIVARARAAAKAERAATAARLRAESDADAAELQAGAEREAEEVRRRAQGQIAAVVAAVVDQVRLDLEDLIASAGPAATERGRA
jgi:vacuolar-type H+-ATPase subunit H